jgi:hypothetical protein
MHAQPLKFIVIVSSLLVFLGLLAFAAILDAHHDPFYHVTCPLCHWQHDFSAILFTAVTLLCALRVAHRNRSAELSQQPGGQRYLISDCLRAPPVSFSK